MDHSEISYKYREKMKTDMCKAIDRLFDKLSEEEDQVKVGLKELEDRFNKALVDTVVAHCEDNQECAPSPPEQQQELRNRVRSEVLPGQEPVPEQDSEPKGSHNGSPGAQKPWESFEERVLRFFGEMLSRQKKMWKDVLASIFDSFVKVVIILTTVVAFLLIVAMCFLI